MTQMRSLTKWCMHLVHYMNLYRGSVVRTLRNACQTRMLLVIAPRLPILKGFYPDPLCSQPRVRKTCLNHTMWLQCGYVTIEWLQYIIVWLSYCVCRSISWQSSFDKPPGGRGVGVTIGAPSAFRPISLPYDSWHRTRTVASPSISQLLLKVVKFQYIRIAKTTVHVLVKH